MSERTAMQMVTASVLGSLLFFTVSFAEEEKTVGQEVVVFDEASNKEIKYCDSTMTDMCECRKGLSDNPENAVPANECVLLNIGLGRARYSALTESITLQLNELAPNSALYSPSGFKVVAGYAVYGVSREKNASNVPKHVQITDPSGVITRFLFSDGESVAVPFAAIGNRTDGRLAMVDAEGWATAADPAYYDFYPGDGSLWRFGASPAAADYLRFVFHQTPQGRVETPQDMGVEIIRDADGVLRQVMTPAWLADFAVTGQDGYDLRLYPHDASCVPGTRSADGTYVIAQGAAPDAVWEFRNPQPGVPRELSVTRKRGDVSETWLYRYEEAVQDFTLVYPQGVMVKRLERVYSDDKQSWTLKRTLTASDGKVVRAEQKHFVNSVSGSLLTESVRDPEGLNLVKRYDYYQDSVLNRLLKAAVNEDGSWSRYEYDGQRRKTAEIRPWLDSPTNAPNNQCEVTRYSYTLFAPGDFIAYNDQRPRLETKEICGVEVSRTYHAYPTNALGQAQEIEERAAFQGAPYGHASNPRTVKTYYAAGAASPLPGRLATITYPGGKTESYGYEYGAFNASTFVFTPDPNGGTWRETVTTSYGANSGVQFLRSARVWDEKGREVLDESYVEDGAAFARIGWTRMSYDRNGKLTETAYSDGRIVSATWGANCCGKESETSAAGIITVYGYNELKQKISETKKGMAADGSGDIATLYTYDLENRVLSTAVTNVASSLGYVASRNAYDAVGRVTNAVDRLGNPTVTAYDALATSVHRPNGVTSVTERYLDGQTKRVLENGVVKHSYVYGVSPGGTRWVLSAAGSLPAIDPLTDVADLLPLTSGLDFPWSLSVADPLNHPVAQHKPGFSRTVLVTSNAYDIAGNLLRVERRVSGVESRLLDTILYANHAAGNRVLTALDLNTNGVIDLAGPDRVNGNTVGYEKIGCDWFRASYSFVYPEKDADTVVTTGMQRVQLTGLGFQQGDPGVLSALSQSRDIRGNISTAETWVDREARKTTQFARQSTSILPSIQRSINGLRTLTASSTAVTNTFNYDALGRQTGITDGRGNSTAAAYTIAGLVESTEDAVSNRTSYGYDSLGRRTTVTDALNNSENTVYDAEGRILATWGTSYPVAYEYDLHGRMIAMATTRDESLRSANLLNQLLAGETITSHHAAIQSGLVSALDITLWCYDNPTGLLTNKLYADNKGYSYAYSPVGKLARRTWARGIATDYAYDFAGSLTNVIYGDATPDVFFTYDRLGRQLSASSSVSTNFFVYSPSTLELEYEIQGDVKIDRFIDAWGRSTGYSLSFSGEQPIASVSYSYDVNNHFESVDSDQFMVANHCTYAYLPGTDLVQSMTKDSGLSWGRYYEDKRDLIYAVSNRFNDTLISFSEFVNDPIGRQIGGSNYTVNRGPTKPNYFGYNIFSEITNAVTGVGTFGYSYDPIGNRNWEVKGAEATEYLANGINQYTNIVDRIATAPTYDLDGNILRDRQFAYRWDAENRLVGLSNLVSSESSEYHYDSRSRRISKTVVDPSSSTLQSVYFVYDGWNLVCELKCCPNTVFTNLYVWGLDVSGSLQGAGGVGGLLSATVSNETYNPAYVNKFNVSEMVRSDGTVVAHYEYDPFGNTTLVDGNMSAVFPFRYSTKYTDPESGFPYYGYRYLSPSLSRWLNRDPVDEQGGVMVYGFVKNNPVNLVDKYGLYAVEKAYFNDLPQATGFTQAILQPNKELELNFDKNSCTCSVKQPEEFKLYLDIYLPPEGLYNDAWVTSPYIADVAEHEGKHVKVHEHYGQILSKFEGWQQKQTESGRSDEECFAKLTQKIMGCRAKAMSSYNSKCGRTNATGDGQGYETELQFDYYDPTVPMVVYKNVYVVRGSWNLVLENNELPCD